MKTLHLRVSLVRPVSGGIENAISFGMRDIQDDETTRAIVRKHAEALIKELQAIPRAD